MCCNNCGNETDGSVRFCGKCGADLGTPEAPGVDSQPDATAPGISKEEYKSAKAAYKQARKDAGKTRTPLVILIIVVLLLVAGGSAFATWYFMDQQAPEPVQQESIEVTNDEDATEEEAEPEEPTNPNEVFIGEWKGSLDSTESGSVSGHRCYGAEEEEMTLTIESISNSGRIKANAKILYHGHESNKSSSDMSTISGDTVLSLDDLTSTFNNSGFSFSAPAIQSGDEIKIEVVPKMAGGTNEPTVTVTSEFGNSIIEKDVYVLKKSGK